MSKLFERRLTFSDELEEALQQLADEACKAPGHCLGINTNRYIAPEGTSLVLKFAEQMCTIELRGGHQAPFAGKEVRVSMKTPTSNTVGEPGWRQKTHATLEQLIASMPSVPPKGGLTKSDKVAYAKDKILRLLAESPMSVRQLAEAIPLVSNGLIAKVLRKMRGIRKWQTKVEGIRQPVYLYELKSAPAAVPKNRRKRTSDDTGVSEPLTVEPGHTGPKNSVAKNIPELHAGRANLDRKVENKPVIRSIKLSRIDGYWRTLYGQFGNNPMTKEQAAEVLGGGSNYAGEILRHMCYLGCADNLPRERSVDARQFFLVGKPSDTRDLNNRLGGAGAATTEPPPTVTKRPTIAAALRARRAKRA